MKQKEQIIADLIQLTETYLPPQSIERIQKAYDFANSHHAGQSRMSNQPYISHPLAVACTLAELELDSSTIIAALLHDTIEDCQVTKEEIISHFDEEIYNLVDGVTKLGKLNFHSEEEHLVENFRKMFLAMAKDLRVILIKLADRLHNMRTLKYLSRDKQIKIARETREIFSPLAHRLGMGNIKWELEDLCFYYLEPEEFQTIKNLVAGRRDDREDYIKTFVNGIKTLVEPVCPNAKVIGRPKHFYSIYKKLLKQKCTYDDLYDTLGVRIIVSTIKECYEIFGLVHSKYKPVSHRIKDFIAMPKSNMYQSLHTTVIGPEGKFVEIQIRTFEMDLIAENGIAAHWKYKEGQSTQKKPDVDFSWLRQIIDSQNEKSSPIEYLQDLKLNLFEDEVFIFTPKGDVQILPKDSTPLDFAYKIHTEIGHRCIGAKVNGEIVNLDYVLQNGDRIDILTTKIPNPKLHWLNIVHTNQAKAKIKQWFKKQLAQETIERGKTLLEEALKEAHSTLKEFVSHEKFDEFLTKHHSKKIEEIYTQIAVGELSFQAIIKFLHIHDKKIDTTDSGAISSDLLQGVTIAPKTKKTSGNGIKVLGYSNVEVHMAKCCDPLPGDAIIGFITKGYGVSVHRKECRNILSLTPELQKRLMEVEWDLQQKDMTYPVTLTIEAFDRIGLLKDIINKVSELKTNILNINSKTNKQDGNVRVELTIEILNFKHLNEVKASIKNISDVYNIYRSFS